MRSDLENMVGKNISVYEKLYGILTEYNARFNLTAIKSKEDYYTKHIADSMLGLPYVSGKVLDIGSGAGFPALVLKIEKPEVDVTMVDSVGKKVGYLQTVIEKLGLHGITALHSRIEDMKERESYDTVTARAVARLATLTEYCLPFVKTGGVFVAYKSADTEEEIKEAGRVIELLGGRTEINDVFDLDGETKRRIIVIRKIKPSPPSYPRKGNKPRKDPVI